MYLWTGGAALPVGCLYFLGLGFFLFSGKMKTEVNSICQSQRMIIVNAHIHAAAMETAAPVRSIIEKKEQEQTAGKMAGSKEQGKKNRE